MTVPAKRIEAALIKVAQMLEFDPAVAPVFERLERELAEARARERSTTDVHRRARMLLAQAQRAKRSSNSRTCKRDAPAP